METETRKACEIVIEWHKGWRQQYELDLMRSRQAKSMLEQNQRLRAAERAATRLEAGIAMAGRLGVPVDCAKDHQGVPVRCSCIREGIKAQRRRKARPR